jgi:sn-glycerol 3-phosphate transport system permease protein
MTDVIAPKSTRRDQSQPLLFSLDNPLIRTDLATAILFLTPSVVIFGVFVYYALGFNFYLSLTSWNFLSENKRFIGLKNFQDLLADPQFWQVLRNTTYFSVGTVSLSMLVGLILALILNEKLPARGVFRTIFFSPYITTTAAIALLWVWIFDPRFGLINYGLGLVGIEGPNWLTNPTWAMPALIIMNVWKMSGYTMVIYLAGLTAIPKDLKDAAQIDGAGRWAVFWKITLPLLSPVSFFVTVTMLLSSFQTFDEVAIMTRGGPVGSTRVFNYYIYEQAFGGFRAGYASAIAVIFFLILLAITIVQVVLSRRWVHYQ